MPRSRKLTAIPFVGKDVPSRASQFSHPDVVIGLTVLSFRYEGLRRIDFETCLSEMKERLDSEYGDYRRRKTAKEYEKWVIQAGARIKGNEEDKKKEGKRERTVSEMLRSELQEIWPLHLLDLNDNEHMDVTYELLHKSPFVIKYYLDTYVFPLTMEHYGEKISASGQELGGNMLFGRRVGFSGTPSDLLPEELGRCQYEAGVDGQIMDYLTDPGIVGTCAVNRGWSVNSLLNLCIGSGFHCLIDTGALITGMSNLDVATYLLENGLSEDFDGVVYLNDHDVQMILLRVGMVSCRLQQAGVPWQRRFTFYDQVHTTGMDIKQYLGAKVKTSHCEERSDEH